MVLEGPYFLPWLVRGDQVFCRGRSGGTDFGGTNYRMTGTVVDRPITGRKRITTQQQDRVITRISLADRRNRGAGAGVKVYFIPRIFYPGDSIYYPADSISLVYFIPRQDILSLHGDQGMSQNISVTTQSSSPAVS